MAVLYGAIVLVLVAILGAGCQSEDSERHLVAPFESQTKVAELNAVWTRTGETRPAEGDPAASELRLRYRLMGRNLLQEGLYVRLSEFQFIDERGRTVAKDAASAECVLRGRSSAQLMEGSVWLPSTGADKVTSFRVESFAVPLSDRGRALYREWRLQREPLNAARIDAEIARYASVPECPADPGTE